MPKSKTHQKRKFKQRKDQQKLYKWATRKAEELANLTPEERAARWAVAPWKKKPEVLDEVHSEEGQDQA